MVIKIVKSVISFLDKANIHRKKGFAHFAILTSMIL